MLFTQIFNNIEFKYIFHDEFYKWYLIWVKILK